MFFSPIWSLKILAAWPLLYYSLFWYSSTLSSFWRNETDPCQRWLLYTSYWFIGINCNIDCNAYPRDEKCTDSSHNRYAMYPTLFDHSSTSSCVTTRWSATWTCLQSFPCPLTNLPDPCRWKTNTRCSLVERKKGAQGVTIKDADDSSKSHLSGR